MIRWLHPGESPIAVESGTLAWFLRDTEPLPAWSLGEEILADAERARADRIRHPLARSQFVRGRIVLRSALACLGVSTDVPFALSPDGKPHIAGDPFHFNLSHTEGLALFAIGPVRVGVDVERNDPRRDVDGLMRRYFEPDEAAEYFGLPAVQRAAAFLRGWTCKEALVKTTGRGVRDLGLFRVRLAEPGLLAAPPGNWTLDAGEVAPDFAWAIATQGE